MYKAVGCDSCPCPTTRKHKTIPRIGLYKYMYKTAAWDSYPCPDHRHRKLKTIQRIGFYKYMYKAAGWDSHSCPDHRHRKQNYTKDRFVCIHVLRTVGKEPAMKAAKQPEAPDVSSMWPMYLLSTHL